MKNTKYSNDNLLFLPLGGAGEIGMNCNLYHYDNQWIMIDLGVTFNNNDPQSYDLIMPNIDFVLEERINLKALILTHAHEDHIGAVPYLYETLGKVPIYTTPFTASVLKRKFLSSGFTDFEINIMKYDKNYEIGKFEIQIFCLTHSIPEPNAVLIKTPKGNIFHTGDWKLDPDPLVGKPIDHKKLKKFVECGIDVMVCDSTNIFESNPSGSEGEVRNNLKKIFKEKKNGKIVVTCFASNIARIETILKVSEECNKCCLLLGRSLQRIYESAKENNYLLGCRNIVDEKEASMIPDDDLVIICTGSQGESKAALSRLVNGRNKFFNISENDTVIFSSREIPGNEKNINQIKSVVMKNGCKLLDHNNSKVHVSGHPSKNEIKKMYDWISPISLIPVHGEYRHLKEHIDFSKKCGIRDQILVENGDIVKIDSNDEKKIIFKTNFGKQVLKGKKIIPIKDKFFNNLNIISKEGEVFVNLIMNTDDELLSDPIIHCPSILINDTNKVELKNILKNEILNLCKKSIDDNILSDQIKSIVKNSIKNMTGLKPLTFIEIVRL